jgi:hypothetical protein
MVDFDTLLSFQWRAEELIKLLEDETRDSKELIRESERLAQHVAQLLLVLPQSSRRPTSYSSAK